jgi:tetratricopeptide (TPR) repeat protein
VKPGKHRSREVYINGRYHVLRKLGEGAMGTVHLVADTLDEDRLVALKTVRGDVMTAQSHKLFRDEFEAMTQLRHPNVVEVYDFGTILGSNDHFFTMELIEGRNLLDACQSASPQRFYAIAAQICRALEYIHAQGFTHFDLKPDNIMVGASGAVKVMDFGLVEKGSFFQARLLKGTVAYIAPEMIEGQKVDHRLDLYSLGAVLFHVATGRVLFPGETMVQILRRHMRDAPNFTRDLPRPVPAPLVPVLARLLEKDPERRYGSAAEVLADLERLLEREAHEDTREVLGRAVLGGRLVGRDAELGRLKEVFRSRVTEPAEAWPSVVLVTGESGMGKSRLLQEFCHYAQLRGVRFVQGSCLQNGGHSYMPFAEILRALTREILGVQIEPEPALPQAPSVAPVSEKVAIDVRVRSESGAGSLLNFARTLGSENVVLPAMPDAPRAPSESATTIWSTESQRLSPSSQPESAALSAPLVSYGAGGERSLATFRAPLQASAAALSMLVPEDPDLADLAALAADAADATRVAQPGREKDWLMDSIARFLVDVARARPLVLYCSDLHWADDLTVELFARVGRAAHAAARAAHAEDAAPDEAPPRLMLCGCLRGDEVAGTALEKTLEDLAAEGVSQQINLQALKPGNIAEMLQSILGRVDLTPEALSILAERTGGVPFSIEATLQDALEHKAIVRRGSSWVTVAEELRSKVLPATLTEALDRALRSLSDPEQGVLRLLSVCNRPVSAQLLREAGAAAPGDLPLLLSKLRKRHLAQRGWVDGQYQWSLRHAKLRDHVYASVDPALRSRLHGDVGGAIERLHKGKVGERYLEELAGHFQRGGDVEKAVYYSKAAGAQAKRVYDLKRAAALYEQAYDALDELPETEARRLEKADLAVAVAEVSYYSPSERNGARLERALDVAKGAFDADRCARVHNWLGRTYYALGRNGEAVRCFQELMRLTEGTDDDQTRALPYSVLGRVYIFMGRFEPARAYLERAAKLLSGQPGCEEDLSYALGMLGGCYIYLGDFDRSKRLTTRSIELAEALGHPTRIAQGHIYLGISHAIQGEWAAARASLEQGLDFARRDANVIGVGTGSSFLGLTYLAEGDARRAVDLCRFARDHIAAAGGTWTFSMIGTHLTEALLAAGDADAALRTAEETRSVVEGGERWGESCLYIAKGRVHARLEKALSVAAVDQRSPTFTAKANLALGAFLLDVDEPDQGRPLVEAARASLAALGMSWYVARADKLLAGTPCPTPCP